MTQRTGLGARYRQKSMSCFAIFSEKKGPSLCNAQGTVESHKKENSIANYRQHPWRNWRRVITLGFTKNRFQYTESNESEVNDAEPNRKLQGE